MPLDLQVSIGQLDRIESVLAQVITRLDQLKEMIVANRADFDAAMADLQTKVQRTEDVQQSAVTLIQGIAAQLADALRTNDTAALQALSDKLNSDADALAAAVASATPPAPTP